MVGSGRCREAVFWQLNLVEESDTNQMVILMHKHNWEEKVQTWEVVRENFPEEAAFELRAEDLGQGRGRRCRPPGWEGEELF